MIYRIDDEGESLEILADVIDFTLNLIIQQQTAGHYDAN